MNDHDLLLRMYRTMVSIRLFEEKVQELFLAGEIPGFVHLYLGEEAIATGVCSALRVDDYITSTHRGHGHTIAKGARMDRMMAELFGRRTGYCKGKGGSMHIADFSIGMLGANGVVGGGFNIATGAGLSAKLRKTDQVAVCFFGDGASNRGTFHEAMNMASSWKLPVIFVCENNQWASTTPYRTTTSVENIVDRAVGYGMRGVMVDGNDVLAVHAAAHDAVERARHGGGPTLLEAKTYRMAGHFVGDPEKYRTRDEVNEMKARCPINRFETGAAVSMGLAAADLEAIRREVQAELAEAVAFARSSPFPDPSEALEDLFAESGVDADA
ncbi:MAG TPA: thiamine pyrophosphate-dependent dehydrogenase E1 component subunit alpha [Symbiobacteriaceae bacterium]|jgi:pyruvate dehydrogenase E1 component alpha subunit